MTRAVRRTAFSIALAAVALTAHATPGCRSCALHLFLDDPVPTSAAATADPDKIEAKHRADLDRDIELGKKYAAEVEKDLKISKSEDMTARVQRIGKEIAEIANRYQPRVRWGDKRLNPFEYTFKVVEGKDVNAFSLPGGHIYVYEGLIKFAETDDELAGVLAHEVAHASLRHVAVLQQESSKVDAFSIPLILIGLMTGNLAAVMLPQLVGQAIGSGWSVKAEEAADQAGFDYLRQSKYNATGILTFMERLAYEERLKPKIDWGIYRTHPPSPDRAVSLRSLLSEASMPLQRSVVTTSLRVSTLAAEPSGAIPIRFGETNLIYRFYGPNAAVRAAEATSALNQFFDTEPRTFDATAFDGRTINGYRKPLIRVEPEDMLATGKTEKELRDAALEAIKTVIFRIRYRLWEG